MNYEQYQEINNQARNIRRFTAPILDTCDRVLCDAQHPTVCVDGAAWCEDCARLYVDDLYSYPLINNG